MGSRKIIVSERDNIAALFEDDQAIEFIIHRGDILLGDVYLAAVENILPSIDAAFVNVGGDKMGFLHSSDVPGKGELKSRLQPKQQLVVQVMKEPTGHKGPRVTTNVSLPGRFLVLMPESKGISISRKIEQQSERSRLKSLVGLIKPPGVGVIIRTEADQQKESDIQEDFETLLERWQNIVSLADSANPPTLLYRDQDLLYRVIREAVTDDVKDLYVDTTFGQQRAQQLLQNWNMDKTIKVSLYTGNQSILIGMGVDKEIKQALQTKVPLPSGGYLYIQPTEALCVIDVNSGKFTSLQSQADTIRQTNLEATKEIARQLRLRNIGGMIVVDFIDMESRADKLSILEAFENELSPDKSKPQIGQLSDLGLVEMTRHRQGQALSEIFTKRCIACNGTGHAIDELNWAPPTVDGDPRSAVRGAPRNKLPIRQVRPSGQQQQHQHHHQGHARSGASSGSQAPPVQSVNATLALKKMIEPVITPILTAPKMGRSVTDMLNRESGKTKEVLPPDKPLGELLKDRVIQKFGIRLSDTVKLAHTPPGINNIFIRINPKSNDVLTLVDAMEGSAFMPMANMLEDDEMIPGSVPGDSEETESRPPTHSREGQRSLAFSPEEISRSTTSGTLEVYPDDEPIPVGAYPGTDRFDTPHESFSGDTSNFESDDVAGGERRGERRGEGRRDPRGSQGISPEFVERDPHDRRDSFAASPEFLETMADLSDEDEDEESEDEIDSFSPHKPSVGVERGKPPKRGRGRPTTTKRIKPQGASALSQESVQESLDLDDSGGGSGEQPKKGRRPTPYTTTPEP